MLEVFKCIVSANIENYKIKVVTSEDKRPLNEVFKGVKAVGNDINVEDIAPAGIYITTDEYCNRIGKPDAFFEDKLHNIVFYADRSCMDNKMLAKLFTIEKVMEEEEILVCEKCGSKDVEYLAWVDANTHEYKCSSDLDEEGNFCNKCREHVYLVTEKEYKDGKG